MKVKYEIRFSAFFIQILGRKNRCMSDTLFMARGIIATG